MLDSTTRSKIDALRDTLVGKLPVPSEQVKQITLGLMYKFMGDLDEEYAKLGSKPFFGGKYERYAWRNIMALTEAPKRAELYVEGIEKMSLNPGIPQLFRDIFKGAFFPFRDPRIIGEFLKGIDEFKYEHSEDLGDAFEYLLQVSGEQGKAGQLRTPRHIIDFIVECVDPQKTDRVLDPACGTAGFLVSAYKHILRENTRPGSDRPGSALTTTERNALRGNFTGYDISHDMVRISLVNMYLHLFPNPRIYEYDTLTSQERWDEDADCILANPPFMTPKGGIRPHSRFQIKAHRSEILFVDYMLEHLSPQGKMGVIVPEGIIFQSNTAYKALRKLLVDGGYLYAVVSLPGGVFNPYSGVTTSILLIDRVLAKKAQDILFVRVENDGFDLGAQRRQIDKNDLPQTLKTILAYKEAIAKGENPRRSFPRVRPDVVANQAKLLGAVPKSEVAGSQDYGLSAERYRAPDAVANRAWPTVRLGSVAEIGAGDAAPQEPRRFENGQTPFFRTSDVGAVHLCRSLIDVRDMLSEDAVRELKMTVWPVGTVLFPKSGASTFLNHRVRLGVAGCVSSHLAAIVAKPNEALSEFLYYVLTSVDARKLTQVQAYPSLRLSDISAIEIPLPPLTIQQEIVAELDAYQKVIDGARAVVDNYRAHIPIDPDWPVVKLGEACDVRDGTHDSPRYVPQGYPLITSKNLKNGRIDFSNVDLISREDLDAINKRSRVDEGDILMPMIGTIGNPVIADTSREYAVKNVALIKFRKDSKVDNRFLKAVLASVEMQGQFDRKASGSTQKFIPLGFIRALSIPLPSLVTQQTIAAEIEAEQQLVAANGELIARFEKKIRAALARVWGRDRAKGG